MNNHTDAYVRLLLSAVITLGFFGTVAMLLFASTPPDHRDVLLVLIGALVANYKDVISFYFSTSASSQAKDATIRELATARAPDGPMAPVSVAALPAALEATLPSALDATLPAALDAALADPVPKPANLTEKVTS